MTRSATASSFLKSSLALMSGTVLTQAIVFLSSPLLSRIFGLVDFGNLANYNAWVAMLALVSSLRYEHAVIVTKDRDDTNRVVALTAILSLASCVLFALVAGALHVSHAAATYLAEMQGFLLLIPLGVLSVCASSLLIQLNVKAGRFKRLAAVTVAQVGLTIVSQVALGLLHVRHGLIIGTIAGYLLSGIVLARLSLKEDGFNNLRLAMTLPQLRAAARKYLNFPRYTLATDALNVLVQQFTPVLILAFFTPAVAGLYAFAIRVVRVPLIVISTAVSTVLRKEGADRHNDGGTLHPLFTTIVGVLFVVGLVPFVVILFYGDRLFSVVFGAQWLDAGRIVQILSPGIMLEFVAFPLSIFFIVTNTQRYTFALQALSFGALLAAVLVGKRYLDDFMATCYLISAVMVVANLATIALARKVSGSKRSPSTLGTGHPDGAPDKVSLVHPDPTGTAP